MVALRRFPLRAAVFALLMLFVLPTARGADAKLDWLKGFPQRIGSQAVLMWTPVLDAAKYQLTRTDEATGTSASWDTPQNNYVDLRADLEKTYLYQVRAFGKNGVLLASSRTAKLERFKRLDPPKWGGSHQDEGGVYLVWQRDPGAAYYSVFKAMRDEAPVVLASTSSVNYVDKDVKQGETYVYKVRAVDQSGNESKDSELLTVVVNFEAASGKREIERRKVEVTRFELAPEVKIGEPTQLLFRNGLMYLTDTASRSVMVIALDGNLVRKIATRPPDYKGAWGIPWGISSDQAGKRFAVTFMQSPNVRLFDEMGQILQDIQVTPPPELDKEKYPPLKPQPMNVLVEDQEGLWVTDYTYAQVINYSVRGRETGRVGTPKVLKDHEPFRSPTFMVLNPKTSEVNVVDSLQAKVFRLSTDGKILGSWGADIEGDGALHLPKGIEVTEGGEFLIVDGILSTLQAFDKTGKLVAVYEPGDKARAKLPLGLVSVSLNRANGDIYVLSKVENAIFRLSLVK